MLDLDAGDLRRRPWPASCDLVLVRGDRLGDDLDLLHALGLQLLGRVDEPLHLRHLLVLRSASRAGTRCRSTSWPRPRRPMRSGRSARAAAAKATAFKRSFIRLSPRDVLPVVDSQTPAGKLSAGALSDRLSALAHDQRQQQPSTATKLIQIDGSCSRPNQSIILSLTADEGQVDVGRARAGR